MLRAAALVLALVAAAGALAAGPEPEARRWDAEFRPEERRLAIHVAASPSSTELRITINGLSHPEVGEDVGEPGVIYLPTPSGVADPKQLLQVAQNVYFFNEFADADGWELVMCFGASARGLWKLNGRFSPHGGEQQEEVAIPVADLEAGENLLHLRGPNLEVPRMYFRLRLPPGKSADAVLRTIPANWDGQVSLWHRDATTEKKLGERTIAPTELHAREPTVPERWWEQRNLVRDAALAAGANVVSNQVRRPGSLFEDGFNLVYDPTRKAHRMAHWIWAWGPAIDFLLQLSKLEHDPTRAAQFRNVALGAARRSLAFEETHAGHPARGISSVRWEPSRATPLGWAEYLSPSDSLFMAGWGWMSAFAETKDPIYTRRLEALVAAADRLMDEYSVIPQDWIVERDRWTPHTLDETLFGTIGFRRLHEATGSVRAAEVGRRFLENHLLHMGREDGLLARAWLRDEHKDIWDADIKGHAWVMEGYLDGYRLTGDERYLRLAGQLAAKALACQSDDGSWTFLFKKAAPEEWTDDKGTVIWAFLLYDLHRFSHTPAHLAAARRALGWCLRQQYRGDDPNLDGAIHHPCSMAYVRRRPMTVLYTTTFFGLALLEELAIGDAR